MYQACAAGSVRRHSVLGANSVLKSYLHMRNFLFICILTACLNAVPQHAAVVNGEAIPLQEFEQAVAAAQKTLINGNEVDLNSDEGKFLLMTTQHSILEDMINQMLIRQQAKQMKIEATTADVNEEIERLRKGFPSQKAFEETLAAEQINSEELFAGTRARLVSEKIKKELCSKMDISDKELNNFIRSNREFFGEADEAPVYPNETVTGNPDINSETRKYLVRKKENEVFERWLAKVKNTAKIEINQDILKNEYAPTPRPKTHHRDNAITNGRV